MKFSREQEIKKTYLQLGNKFNVPMDLMIYIYNIIRTNEKKIMKIHDYKMGQNFPDQIQFYLKISYV